MQNRITGSKIVLHAGTDFDFTGLK